jgi:hypothetical protein
MTDGVHNFANTFVSCRHIVNRAFSISHLTWTWMNCDTKGGGGPGMP